MPEILQILQRSPPSLHQFSPGTFDVTDHFQSSEFAGSPFDKFSSSSVDELSKVTAIIEQNHSSKKRKLEFDDVEVDSQRRKAESKVKTGDENSMDPKTDYVHVRVRRGQATDSHSLAERARREKIKKKMQFLQHLVPGRDKISNKAAILDEIIGYVQCLQRQVEFLTMKLAASTPNLDLKEEHLLPKAARNPSI